MFMRFLILATFSILPLNAHAQQKEFTGGIKSMTLYVEPEPETNAQSAEENAVKQPLSKVIPLTTQGNMNAAHLSENHVLAPTRPDIRMRAANEASAQEKKELEQKQSAQKIWNKYKELATGTAPQQAETQKQASAQIATPSEPQVSQPQKPQVLSAQEQAHKDEEEAQQQAAGLQMLLQQYQQNKTQQRQMRSLSFDPQFKTQSQE